MFGGTYHYVSWLQILCFPPRASQSPDSPAGSVCHCGALVNWTELRGGNSVPAPPAASAAPSLSSRPGMEVEGSEVTALNPLPVLLRVGCAGGRGLSRAGRRGCAAAEGWGCRWSRSRSWALPGDEPGSSSREARDELTREEGPQQPQPPGTCAHFQLHPRSPPPPDLQSQSQNRSRNWSGPASQRRSL